MVVCWVNSNKIPMQCLVHRRWCIVRMRCVMVGMQRSEDNFLLSFSQSLCLYGRCFTYWPIFPAPREFITHSTSWGTASKSLCAIGQFFSTKIKGLTCSSPQFSQNGQTWACLSLNSSPTSFLIYPKKSTWSSPCQLTLQVYSKRVGWEGDGVRKRLYGGDQTDKEGMKKRVGSINRPISHDFKGNTLISENKLCLSPGDFIKSSVCQGHRGSFAIVFQTTGYLHLLILILELEATQVAPTLRLLIWLVLGLVAKEVRKWSGNTWVFREDCLPPST